MPRQAFLNCGCPPNSAHLTTCARRRRKKLKKKPEYRPYRGTKAHREMRKLVWHRDGGRCRRCGRLIQEGEHWDLGHVIAHADGGEFVAENLGCEHVRGNRGGGRCR